MAQNTVWIVAERGSVPACAVARRTLRKRLDAVWTVLQAAAGPRPDARHVHQLRVATRRTLAALEAFGDLIPEKRRHWFEKRLRRLRRVAGDARDLDVLAARLHTERGRHEPAAAARGRLVAMLSRQRLASRGPIRRMHDDLIAADWHARTERLVAGVRPRGHERPFAAYARRCFRPIVARFFATADRRLKDAGEIHRLRIEGKKLRYAIEIFASVFPTRHRVRCEAALERLQATLGEFTDHAAAADRFRRWARADGVGMQRHTLAALRKREDEQAEKARKAFAKWWNSSRRRWLRRTLERTLGRRCA